MVRGKVVASTLMPWPRWASTPSPWRTSSTTLLRRLTRISTGRTALFEIGILQVADRHLRRLVCTPGDDCTHCIADCFPERGSHHDVSLFPHQPTQAPGHRQTFVYASARSP